MSMRILVRLTGSEHDTSVLNGALAVATQFDGEIDALFVRPDPRMAFESTGEDGYGAVYQSLYESMETSGLERAKAVGKAFEKWCGKHDVRVGRTANAPSLVAAHWHEAVGPEPAILVDMARVSDLTVMARPSDSLADRLDATLEAALMLSGRPVLLVPPKTHAKADLSKILVAWNNSAESARAVGAALPLLKEATKVAVFTAPEGAIENAEAERLVSYLESRGINASKCADDAGKTNSIHGQLMAAIRSTKSDLVVMGAYSHSRVRELILGGVTRHMLTETPALTFIMH